MPSARKLGLPLDVCARDFRRDRGRVAYARAVGPAKACPFLRFTVGGVEPKNSGGDKDQSACLHVVNSS